MCGIAGIAALKGARAPGADVARRMCRTLAHRGPDDEGVDVLDGVALANRRLAVIDLAGGSQPMSNPSRSVRVTQNGEIYNFRDLRDRLEQRGHDFRTSCDTEAIIHTYEELGPDFVSELDGMFAIALHDARNRQLVLARDPLGIKPLYYAWIDDEYLIWGSEIKALLASGLLAPELDVDALGQFLSWEYVPGRRTLFGNVHELEPAETLTVDLDRGSWRSRRYWDIAPAGEQETLGAHDWEDLVDDTIRRAVRRQLVSDVPLGAFFSGGVDSSLVVAAMESAKVFSIGFDDVSYNELDYARRTAKHLGVAHVCEILKPDAASLFDALMQHLDDPIGDFSIFPTYLLSDITRGHVTVALSGDGGDELFGGYETYLAQRYAHWYQYLPACFRRAWLPALAQRLRPTSQKKGAINSFRRFVEGTTYPDALGHARWRIFASDLLKTELFTAEAAARLTTPTGAHIESLFERASGLSGLDRSLYVDLKSYLSDNCLVKVDRMSMAVSLEVRVPLLDKELVELAFRVPQELKIHRGTTKAILKRIAARHVPRECVYRRKQGFSIPMKRWLAAEFREIMNEALDARKIREDGLFRPSTVETLKREHLQGRANHSHILWSLIVFQAWKERWLERRA